MAAMSLRPTNLIQTLSTIDDWGTTHPAAAVLTPGASVFSHGDIDATHPVASITKLVTALSVLVAIEEGSISLDEPAGPPGSTVRHLLCHASGLPFEGWDPIAPPGTRRIYSNSGYLALADLLTQHTGIAFTDYATEAVLEPLAMTTAWFSGRADAGLTASVRDLICLAAELLTPTIIDRSTWQAAVGQQMPDLAGVLPGWGPYDPCPWGLGPEIRGTKSPHWTGSTAPAATFGHFGGAGTFLWVDPVNGVGCVVIAGRRFGPWAIEVWPGFSDAVRYWATTP